MKIYVQNVNTGKYFSGADVWTSNPERALSFPNAVAALNFCQALENADPDVQLIMRFGQPDGNLRLQVAEGKISPPPRSLAYSSIY